MKFQCKHTNPKKYTKRSRNEELNILPNKHSLVESIKLYSGSIKLACILIACSKCNDKTTLNNLNQEKKRPIGISLNNMELINIQCSAKDNLSSSANF